MKRASEIILIFIIVVFLILLGGEAFCQPGTTPQQTIGNQSVILKARGFFTSDKGLYLPDFIDTATANAGNIDLFPGAMIRTRNATWLRDSAAKRWIPFSGGTSTTNTTLLNDTTLIICNAQGRCDTVRLTGGGGTTIINNSFINDTTLIYCHAGTAVCDTTTDPFTGATTIICTPTTICDTLRLSTTGLIFQNGIGVRSGNMIELGGKPLIRNTIVSGSNLFDMKFDSTNFYARGIFGRGQDIAISSNPQLVFYSKKAALLAGVETHNFWRDDSIGYYSQNFGVNNIAPQAYSFITGVSNRSDGAINATFGNSNSNAASRGFLTGQENSMTANAYNSLAGGRYTHARSHYNTAIGLGLQSYHYGEAVFGMYNDTLSKANESNFATRVAGYRIFEIGNGTGTGASRSNALTILNDGRIGAGTTTPGAGEILTLTTTNKAFLPPRMTGAQQNAIPSPAAGMIIYNTDSLCHTYYTGAAWLKFGRQFLSTYTASEGLTMTSNNATLGGTITTDRTITLGTKKILLTGSGTYGLHVINSGGGYGIYSENTTGSGIVGSASSSGAGVQGWSTSGNGLFAYTVSGPSAIHTQIDNTNPIITGIAGDANASNNTVVDVMQLTKLTSGTPAVGMGARIRLGAEIGVTSSSYPVAQFEGVITNATEATRSSKVIIRGINNTSEQPFLEMQLGGVNLTNNGTDTLATKAYARSLSSGGSGVTTMAAIGSSPNANGASIAATTLTLQPASASFGGVVTTGTQTFAGAKTFSGDISANNLSGGTYTPTGTAWENVSSVTPTVCQYMRVGNVVTVSGAMSVTASSSSQNTGVALTLPIASNLANYYDAAGTCGIKQSTVIYPGGTVEGYAATDKVLVYFYCTTSGTYTVTFTFTYQII